MKKEILTAIIMGFILGLIITFGLWRANRALQTSENTSPTPTPSLSPLETGENIPTVAPTAGAFDLEITQPANNLLTDKSKITVTGKTKAETILVIFYEEGEKIITAGKDGNFETEVSLIGGVNEIKIKAFDDLGEEVETQLEIIYSTAKV